MSAVKLYGYVETRADEQGYYFYNAPHVYFGFYDYPILNISQSALKNPQKCAICQNW